MTNDDFQFSGAGVNVEANTLSAATGQAPEQGRLGLPARDRRALLYGVSLLLDCLALVGGYGVALELRDQQWLDAGGQPIIVLALPIFLMFEIAREVQSVEALESRSLGTSRALGSLGATALVLIGLTFLFKAEDVSRLGFATTFAVAAVLIVVGKLLLDVLFHRFMKGAATANVLLLDGMAVEPEGLADVVDVKAMGLWPDLNKPAMIDALSRIIAPYDRVVVACRYEHRPAWAMFLRGHDVGGEILLDRDLLHGAVAIGGYANHDTLILSRGPLALANRIQKRAFDLVVATCALVFLAPLLIVVAIAIKLESEGPVFFRQTRVGQGNRQFRIFKFRSMRQEKADEAGDRSTARDDDRVTRVGRIIRRTSIDELPQLFNVIRGEMSMVGPRPHALGSLAGESLFWEVTDRYWLRHALKPGITGLAQIRGLRGATERQEDLEKRLRCDLEYLGDWSLWTDVLIMLKTVRVIVHKNAY